MEYLNTKNYLVVNEFFKNEKFEGLYKRLLEEFALRGEEVEVLTNASARELEKTYGNGTPILFWDKDVYLCSLLQKWGYMPVNTPKAIENCDDKAKTYLKLMDKIAMPETIIAPFTFDSVGYSNFNFLDEVIKRLGFPMVIKQVRGSFGERVFLAHDKNQLIDILKSSNDGVIFQKYIKSSHGKDVRVYVVGGKVVASALRENASDFRSNVACGGSMKAIDLPSAYKNIAVRAVQELHASFAGVDLLIAEDGSPLLCEVNTNAHFAGLESVTGVNVAGEIVDFYLSLRPYAKVTK